MNGEIPVFRKQLLGWFQQNARNLPWRKDPSLYKTVVSEFMLQQTQVETVLPYFRNWLEVFPDFKVLARSDEQKVLKSWEGLGYYSRARNLHKLAKSIASEGVPDTFQDWLKRPGIGPYTAAAISSINQGLPEPVIDGNVIRVLSRLNFDSTPIASSSEARTRFLDQAKGLIDPDSPGDYNEAIMELGATVCRKTRPACLLCPVQQHCQAFLEGNPESIPVIQRKASISRQVARLWLLHQDRILLQFYPLNSTRLAGIAELPELESHPDKKAVLIRSRGISSERIRESVFTLGDKDPLSVHCLSLETTRWVPLVQLSQVPLSGPHKRWIQQILEQQGLDTSD